MVPTQVTAVAPFPAIITAERGFTASDTERDCGQRARSRSASVGTSSSRALWPSFSGVPTYCTGVVVASAVHERIRPRSR